MNKFVSISEQKRADASSSHAWSRVCPVVSEAEALEVLSRLMTSAGWDADHSRIAAALPHEPQEYNGSDIIDSLMALRVPLRRSNATPAAISENAGPKILLYGDDAFAYTTAGQSDREQTLSFHDRTQAEGKPTALFIVGRSKDNEPVRPVQSAAMLLSGLRPHVGALLFASLIINLTGLVTPLFVMLIYNRIIPARADDVLIGVAAGVLLAVLTEVVMRRIRSKTMISLASQLEHRLGLSLLHKLMAFPLASLMQSSVNQQRSRLRQFEGIREAMVGPLVQVGLDIPFVVIFCALLFIIAPPIGWIAVVAALMQIAFLFLIAPSLRRNETIASEAQSDLRRVTETIVTGQEHLRRSGEKSHWQREFADKLEKGLSTTMRAQFWMEASAHGAQSIVLLAGLSSGFLATMMAIEGSLSVGGLVAILVIIWRFLAPVQSVARATGQALSMAQSVKLVDAVLSLPAESYRGPDPTFASAISGPIIFDQVSLRFPGASASALAGVSFPINVGEITLLSGPTLSGKSMVAELIAGLHAPLGGRVLVNGVDTRQIPVDDLRRSIAYSQQEPEFLYGTIGQNFRLAQPGISDTKIEAALAEVGIATLVHDMPEGLETRLKIENLAQMPYGLKQGLSIARTLARPGPIFIFDQPCEGLDPDQATLVRKAILRRRQFGSVLLISTSAPDFEIADRIVLLDRGRMVLNARGAAARKKAKSIMKLASATMVPSGAQT